MLRIWLLALCAVCLLLCRPGQTEDATETSCDDKEVEAAVDLALMTYNGNLQHGNQLALYQIVKATKVVNESSILFTLNWVVRESDCPVGGDKVWRDCDYLPQGHKGLSPCTATVYQSQLDGNQRTISVDCMHTVEPVVVAERAPCLGCRETIDIMNEDVKEPLMYSLAKFNAEANKSHHFLLRDVVSATRQVVAGFRYDFKFEMEKSNCSKSDFKEMTEECHPTDTEPEFSNCNSTVYIAPWRREEPDGHLDCRQGLVLQSAVLLSRRRPPGWSPLRNFNNFAVKVPLPVDPTPTPPPNPTAKEESSEESHEATLSPPGPPAMDPVASGTSMATQHHAILLELPAAEPASPLNCPSKPWKQFTPVTTPIPSQQEPTAAPGQPTEHRGFSDLDLLG
ncbi:hypothetical protein AAFF_G00003350 [Aldrovandia affinis]|uniref:Cystatin kininogen-type domain-containing protein n=1 Tax=Aldrovandia affinis TaxID=143900 RepID=A0AAD7TEZ0_9TELE|nr:hypothetical protein AAFF_G00003350 [Aldrovandia affinis]